MKQLFLTFLFLSLFCPSIFGQKIQTIQQANGSDSSFYHLAKIDKNEFWAGGEFGILKKIDSLGNVSLLNFPNQGLNILKIERVQNYVFILTDSAVIYRYDIQQKTFFKKDFSDFKNKCFYDLIALPNGKLLVCGGTSGISKGEKKIPKGFIAIVDQDLKEINTIWKSCRKFVWSMLVLENGHVLAATFNGLNTRIIETENYKKWKTDNKIKGLVHEIALLDNTVWYSGTRSFHYKKDGIIGIKGMKPLLLNKSGCVWSMEGINNKVIAVTEKGRLLLINRDLTETKQIETPTSSSLYDIQKISESKYLMIGHGKSIYIIDFNQK